MAPTIIDFTLIEAFRVNCRITSLEIIKMAAYLLEMGADVLCVDRRFKKLLGQVYGDIKLIDIEEKFVEAEIDLINEASIKTVSNLLEGKKDKVLLIKGLYRCLPWKMEDYIKILRDNIKVPVAFCPYDSTGMATALAVEAAKAGADYILTCFAGKGKSNNYSALEEVIMTLNLLYGLDKAFNMSNAQKMARLYQWSAWTDISGRKPILGKDIFKCESGIHGDGIIKNRRTYEPYPPEMVGQRTELVLGKHSGKSMVIEKLRSINIECSDREALVMLDKIKAIGGTGVYMDDKLLKQMFISMHQNIAK